MYWVLAVSICKSHMGREWWNNTPLPTFQALALVDNSLIICAPGYHGYLDSCWWPKEQYKKGLPCYVTYSTYCNSKNSVYSIYKLVKHQWLSWFILFFFIFFSQYFTQPWCLSCFFSLILFLWIALITLTEGSFRSGYAFVLTYHTEKYRWNNKKNGILIWKGWVKWPRKSFQATTIQDKTTKSQKGRETSNLPDYLCKSF